uniref:Ig-like domain-containing protein n=1 Tax=Anopheles quadriannulatus TaxID=34691 RepID=A0A182WSM0_ANOQN
MPDLNSQTRLHRRFNGLCSLKDLKIFVPEAVIMGNAATLSCQFELEKATLYSVRWYFEGEEFYRFVPKESPPARTFPVSGITVDLNKVRTRLSSFENGAALQLVDG